jgi:hypothetical protein
MADQADRVYQVLLVVRCQAGDPAAFAELVGLYQSRLLYFLRKVTGESADTEDMLQDIWLDVFRGSAQLADPVADELVKMISGGKTKRPHTDAPAVRQVGAGWSLWRDRSAS